MSPVVMLLTRVSPEASVYIFSWYSVTVLSGSVQLKPTSTERPVTEFTAFWNLLAGASSAGPAVARISV